MKFENYLTEKKEIELKKGLDYYIPKIKKECKPFIDDIRGAAGTLFRDDRKNRDKPIWKKITRTDRKPLDTPTRIHEPINKMFKDEYGWSARSEGLFCYALRFDDILVQEKWLVFPAGKYEYLWSKDVYDLWGDLADAPRGKEIEYFEDKFLHTYHKDKIKLATKHGNEVMVRCKYSYLCRLELIDALNEALDLRWQYPKMRFRRI